MPNSTGSNLSRTAPVEKIAHDGECSGLPRRIALPTDEPLKVTKDCIGLQIQALEGAILVADRLSDLLGIVRSYYLVEVFLHSSLFAAAVAEEVGSFVR